MNELAEKFSKWAKSNGWRVEPAGENRGLPKAVSERYVHIPSDWIDFIQSFKVCINGENNLYFLLPEDFDDEVPESAFRWNEFELISLESAAGDGKWQTDIRAFWDNCLPVVMSVAGDYHYYAIGIKTGEIFDGWAPEFEEIEIVAASFTDFIENIISGKIVLN